MADVGDIIRLVVEYSIPGASTVLNVFHWLIVDGNPDSPDVIDDFEDWVTNVWGVDWTDLAQSACSIIGLALDIVDVSGHVLENIGAETLAIAGGVGGEVGVAAASAFMKADTALPKTRGTKYIPGLGEGNLTDGLLTTETLGDVALLFLDYILLYIGAVSSARYVPGVVSRTEEAFVEFEGGGYFTDVPAYQRRRKPGVGS
jgi:hypothetical protein